MAAHHVFDAEPFCCADECSHVARVGDAVQGEDEARVGHCFALFRNPDYSQDAGRRVLAAHLLHLHLADAFGVGEGRVGFGEGLGGIDPHRFEVGTEQFLHHFASFHNEEAELFPEFLLFQ